MVIHPILFALQPILSLFSANYGEVWLSVILRPILFLLALVGILWLLLQAAFRNWHKSGILTSVIFFEVFSYGQIYNWLDQHPIAGIDLGRHKLMIPLVVLITGLVIWQLVRTKKSLKDLTIFLNIFGGIACLIPLVMTAPSVIRTELIKPQKAASTAVISADSNFPDIYYIILDGYARSDFLKNEFDYDNSAFIAQLIDLGFQVPVCSQSNYSVTRMSLTSSLNMEYLQPLLESKGIPWNDQTNKSRIIDLLDHNQVRNDLEQLGYHTYAFETGYRFTEWKDADVYLASGKDLIALDKYLTEKPNNFESMLIRSTILRVFMDTGAKVGQKLVKLTEQNEKQNHYQQIMFALDSLSKLPSSNSPRFVFAHIVIPHYPFIVNPDGVFISSMEKENPGYINQVKFLNNRMPVILKTIIDHSITPPIIIVQGDHGVKRFGKDDVKILNAYYFGGKPEIVLYDSITPVNTFRLVFDQYFGKDVELLPDQSYYSAEDDFYRISPVNKSCPN